jgi:transaldolase
MKFFIDTADITEIREAASWGIVDGVTTNPSLISKTGRPYEQVLREICETVDGPVSAEVIATEAGAMLSEGEKLAKIHPNIVVKCPMIVEGLKATRMLSKRGIRVNVTLIFTPLQALLAAKCGATFLSPFIGRLDDIGQDGFQIVEQMMQILSNYDYKAEVLVASVRNLTHLLRAAEVGAHIATVPFAQLKQMIHHPLTDLGLERFLADWRKTNQKI